MQNSNLPSFEELAFQWLKGQVDDLKRRTSVTDTARERSEVTGGIAGITLNTLPTTNNTPGDLYHVTNGCKPGESPGAGTGTAVYFNGTTNSWLRVADNAAPDGTGSANAYIFGPSATNRVLFFRTINSNRWAIYANNTAESGANAGSDLAVNFYSDSGTFLGIALSIIRASGVLLPLQAASAPAYVKGGLWYNTTASKLMIGGASGWETVTSA